MEDLIDEEVIARGFDLRGLAEVGDIDVDELPFFIEGVDVTADFVVVGAGVCLGCAASCDVACVWASWGVLSEGKARGDLRRHGVGLAYIYAWVGGGVWRMVGRRRKEKDPMVGQIGFLCGGYGWLGSGGDTSNVIQANPACYAQVASSLLCRGWLSLRAGKIAILRLGVWGVVLRAGGCLLELVDLARYGACLMFEIYCVAYM